MIKCIAIDDEPLALDVITDYVSLSKDFYLQGTFRSARAALAYAELKSIGLMFLDIQMPAMNGMEFFKSIVDPPLVIFTTAHSDFAVEGFDLEAVDYLLKPIEPQRFQKALEKAKAMHKFKQGQFANAEFLFIRSDYQLVKVLLTEIEYVEGMNDYVKIFRKDAKPVMSLVTMKSLTERLDEKRFLRIHRSYIVPITGIQSYNSRHVFLHDRALPIGDTYKEQVKRAMEG